MYLSVDRLKKFTFRPALMLFVLFSTGAIADPSQRWQLNMSPGVTELGQKIYDLHMAVTIICCVIALFVFIPLTIIIVKHRKSTGKQAATWHENLFFELSWTIIPFFILGFMAYPSTMTLIEAYDTSDSDIDILVTGYQWKWKYEYLGKDGKNFSFMSNLSTPRDVIYGDPTERENYLLEVDEPLLIPVNQKTRFLVTAADVIHAWWVPDLAVKKDATPGYINEAYTIPTKTGTYRGQCAELCGKDHGFMPIVVKVVEQAEFDAWVEEKSKAVDLSPKTFDELMALGKDLYATNCAACHGVNGEGIAGAFPGLKGSPIAVGDMTGHLDIVVNGKPGTAMAAYGSQLDALKLAAIITYERNAWGNNAGDSVQATDVLNYMNGGAK